VNRASRDIEIEDDLREEHGGRAGAGVLEAFKHPPRPRPFPPDHRSLALRHQRALAVAGIGPLAAGEGLGTAAKPHPRGVIADRLAAQNHGIGQVPSWIRR